MSPTRRLRVGRIAASAIALGLLMFPLNTRVQAADTGLRSPAATGGSHNQWSSPGNAFASDDVYATETTEDQDQSYERFGLNVPVGSIINGIEVRIEGRHSDSTGCQIEPRMWSRENNAHSLRRVRSVTAVDAVYVLGSPTDTWGLTWMATDFSDANFHVEVRFDDANESSGSCSQGTFRLDHIQVKVYYTPPVQNPPLAQSCGLDIVLVIDSSGSIDANELGEMRTALKAFVDAFLPATPTEMAVIEFDDQATLRQGFTADVTALKGAIDIAASGGWTNWDDALFDARGLFPHRANPDLIVFASDGNPTRRGGHLGHPLSGGGIAESLGMEWAILEANAARLASIRIVALGIGGGSGEAEALDLANLIAISGPNVADEPGEIGIGTDVVLTSFDTMAEALSELALELCGGTITVHKVIDGDGDPGTPGDQINGAGWSFAADASPDTATPASGLTDSAGLINFDIDLGPDGIASVDILETVEVGYSFISAGCVDQGGAPVGTPGVNSVGDIAIGAMDIVLCTFYNRGTVDLYILDIDDELGGDELIFNLVAENILPGETQSWILSLRNGGTLPWDLDPLTDIDASLSSGWSCEGDATPEFSVAFIPALPFPDGDDHESLIHVDPRDSQNIEVKVTLAPSAGNDCQGDVFNLVAMLTVTQHLP